MLMRLFISAVLAMFTSKLTGQDLLFYKTIPASFQDSVNSGTAFHIKGFVDDVDSGIIYMYNQNFDMLDSSRIIEGRFAFLVKPRR